MDSRYKKYRKKATAIGYDKEQDKAPRLLAKGDGKNAEKILEKAKEHNITIKEDPDLVEAFAALEIDQEIPEELYRVTAELLAEVYKINKTIKK